MSIGLFHRIAELFSAAARAADKDSKHMLTAMPQKAKERLKHFSSSRDPFLDTGLRFASNLGKQTMGVLKKKEKMADNALKASEGFWNNEETRQKQISERLKNLAEKKSDEDLTPEEMKDLTKQEMLLHDELEAIGHLEKDAERIENFLKDKRNHDLMPLLAKSDHIVKIINFEERKGAVSPGIMKEIEAYELALFRKIEQTESHAKTIEQDEFGAAEHILADLKKEIRLLKKEYDENRDKKAGKDIKKRINQAIAQSLMLQNLLQMGSIEGMMQKKLREKAIRIYSLIDWIKKAEEQEKNIIQQKS